MIDLPGSKLEELAIGKLEFVRHLEYYEFPLITEFVSESNDRFLKYWCDCEENVDRWMFVRLSKTDITRICNKMVPFSYAIPARILDNFVFMTDENPDGSVNYVRIVPTARIPQHYLPKAKSFLSRPVLSPGMLPILIENSDFSIHELPAKIRRVYDFLYNAIKLQGQPFTSRPWQDGFSSMHFFNELHESVPGGDRMTIPSFQYNSPGLFELKLNPEISETLIDLFERYKRNTTDFNDPRRALETFIIQENLNSRMKEDASDSLEDVKDALKKLTSSALTVFGTNVQQFVFENAPTTFQASKITLSLHRRIREIVSFERNGLVSFPDG